MSDAIVVFCTCTDQEQALRIANALVDDRLAACVNLLPPVQSIYRWQENKECAEEILLLIKTTQERFPALRERILELHSYDTPEVICMAIADGSEKYLSWLRLQV